MAPGVTFAQTGGGYDLPLNTIDGGGGTAAGGIYVIDATIGQPDAGGAAGGSYQFIERLPVQAELAAPRA